MATTRTLTLTISRVTVDTIKNNKTLDDIATQFGLERSTISKILKTRDDTIQKILNKSLIISINAWILVMFSNKVL